MTGINSPCQQTSFGCTGIAGTLQNNQ